MDIEKIAQELAFGRRSQAASERHIGQWLATRERKFSAESKGTDLEINILDVIGCGYWFEGVSAKTVKRALDSNPNAKLIRLVIDSPGGDAFDGIAIQNLLKRHPATVEAEVVGEASSAASIILMGCDKVIMHEGSMMMIHRASGGKFGHSEELRTWADALDKLTESLIDVYTTRSGKDREEVAAMVLAETWMKADEAVSLGFADAVEKARTAPKPAGTADPAPAPADDDPNKIELDIDVHTSRRAENLIAAANLPQLGALSALSPKTRPPIAGLATQRTNK